MKKFIGIILLFTSLLGCKKQPIIEIVFAKEPVFITIYDTTGVILYMRVDTLMEPYIFEDWVIPAYGKIGMYSIHSSK